MIDHRELVAAQDEVARVVVAMTKGERLRRELRRQSVRSSESSSSRSRRREHPLPRSLRGSAGGRKRARRRTSSRRRRFEAARNRLAPGTAPLPRAWSRTSIEIDFSIERVLADRPCSPRSTASWRRRSPRSSRRRMPRSPVDFVNLRNAQRNRLEELRDVEKRKLPRIEGRGQEREDPRFAFGRLRPESRDGSTHLRRAVREPRRGQIGRSRPREELAHPRIDQRDAVLPLLSSATTRSSWISRRLKSGPVGAELEDHLVLELGLRTAAPLRRSRHSFRATHPRGWKRRPSRPRSRASPREPRGIALRESRCLGSEPLLRRAYRLPVENARRRSVHDRVRPPSHRPLVLEDPVADHGERRLPVPARGVDGDPSSVLNRTEGALLFDEPRQQLFLEPARLSRKEVDHRGVEEPYPREHQLGARLGLPAVLDAQDLPAACRRESRNSRRRAGLARSSRVALALERAWTSAIFGRSKSRKRVPVQEEKRPLPQVARPLSSSRRPFREARSRAIDEWTASRPRARGPARASPADGEGSPPPPGFPDGRFSEACTRSSVGREAEARAWRSRW